MPSPKRKKSSASLPRLGEPLRPLNRSLAGVIIIQALDAVVHLATGNIELLRISASVMLVVGAWMMLRSPAGAKGVGMANGFAYLVLNGVFLSVHGLTNAATGNLRIPLFVLVIASLLALWYHASLVQRFTQD